MVTLNGYFNNKTVLQFKKVVYLCIRVIRDNGKTKQTKELRLFLSHYLLYFCGLLNACKIARYEINASYCVVSSSMLQNLRY